MKRVLICLFLLCSFFSLFSQTPKQATVSGLVMLDSAYFADHPIFYIGSQLDGFGDSYMAGLGATTTDSFLLNDMQFYYYGAYTGTNYGISASGIWSAASQMIGAINTPSGGGNTHMVTFECVLNDLRRSGYNQSTLRKVVNCYKAAWANLYLKSWQTALTGSSVTRYGAWNSYNSSSVGGKSTGNAGAYTATQNDSITYTFNDSTVVVGLIGADGTTNTYSNFNVYIDNVLQAPQNNGTENFQYDGISDGVYDNKRGPMELIYNGLVYGPHTIKLVNTSVSTSFFFVVDYFGNLVDSHNKSLVKPMIVYEVPYLPTSSYAISPSNGSKSITDSFNLRIDSLFIGSALPTYPVVVVKTNNYTNVTTDMYTDSIHRNNKGYRNMAFGASVALSLSEFTPPNNRWQYYSNRGYIGLNEIAYVSDISSGLTGSLTNNFLPVATGVNTLTNSVVQQNGSTIGINTTPNSSYSLDVFGSSNPATRIVNGSTNQGTFGVFGDQFGLSVNRGFTTGTFLIATKAAAQITLKGAASDGEIDFFTTNSNNTIPVQNFSIFGNGNVVVGKGSGSNPGNAAFTVADSTQAQLDLIYNSGNHGTVKLTSAGSFVFSPGGGMNGFGVATPAAIVDMTGGSASIAQMHFSNSTLTSTLTQGNLGMHNGLWIADSSSSVRDTFGTRSWIRNYISNFGTPTLQQVLTAGSTTTGANTITNTGNTLTWTGGTYKYNGILSGVGTLSIFVHASDSSIQQLTIGSGLSVSGGALTASGGSGVTTVGSFSASAQTNGASISGTTITFGPANQSTPGMMSTGNQSFAGNKSFAGITKVLNEQDSATTLTTGVLGVGAGSGSGGTFTQSGGNRGGTISITTGTVTTTTQSIWGASYNNSVSFPNGSSVVLYPANANAAGLAGTSAVWVSCANNGFVIEPGTVALVPSTNYVWSYQVVGF